MARSSLVHYIIPSAISITPNCNSSVSDLAVYVARGTKIKVNSKKAGIDTAGGSYQEWVLTGRNRRLADSAVPYTIYARLRKTDKTDGYLMFVPQQKVSGQWKDKYPYVTTDGLYRDVYGQESSVYYYIRLGDVTLPGADGREVILDTGILGTEQYNEEWNLNPDNLPVRVDIGCTIDDEDAGPTPYVYFGKTLVLTASLQEGWSDTDVERFDHWEIARNTGDATADAAWPSQERQAQFAESGTIDLVHTRDDDDDFNGAVSGIFTVTAWGIEDDSSGTPAPVVIATASISIMAETVEKYDLQLSANIVSYSPQTGAYTPADGVKVAIRATDQRGDVFNMTNAQVQSGRLSADYAPVDSSDWTPLVFSGGAAEEAQATIPISAFSSEQGLKVRLLRTVDASTGQVMEMTNATIAFVRDGEDSKEREWIFQHTLTVTTYGDEHSEHPRPSVIDGGEVKPSGVAGGDDHNKDQDGWVPQGWCDNPQGIDETYQFEYGSYRDFIHSDSSGSSSERGGHWGEFTEPRIWNHYAGDAVTYDIVPSVSVINADAAGTVTSDGIIVRAYQTKGSERSENILPNSDYPESGDYYFAEYSVDGGEWTRCEAFDYPAAGGTVIPVYGIPADAVRTATEGITLRLKHSSDITFVLKENTPIKVLRVISEDEVSDMVQELGREEFLSRLYDDFASGEIGFLKGLWVKAKNLYGISEDGDARLHDTDISGTAHVGEDLNIDGELHGISAVLNKIVSSEYTGDGMLDTGFLLQYAEGRAKLVVDDLVARGKFTVNELETRIWTYAGGNMIFSGAGSTVFFVEYLDADENILGYTSINAPWLLNGRPLLSAMVAWSKRRWVQRSLTDEEKAAVVKFRCYEYSDDGTMQTRNWWHVNDLALCQTLNKVKDKVNSDGSYSGYASNTVYHRRVAGIGSKKIAAMGDDRVYDYVDLWNIYDVQGQTYIDAQGQERTITDDVKGFLNMAPTGQAPSTDWPAAGDVIVQVGNPLDTDRQGAVTIEVQGDTHGLKVYDTISGYSMENKLWVEIGYDQTSGKAKANVYGDFRFGCRASEEQGGGSYVKYNRTTGKLDIRANVHFTSPTTHTPTTLDNFASAVVGDLNSLQSQIDGQIESWFYNYSPVATDSQGVPTSNVPLNVAPYSEWTTDALKIAHLNDTFTNNKSGYCWRFSRNASTNAFEWVIIEDSAVIKALQDAAKAQDTADHKRRVFICDADNQTPVPPYDPGDLWVNVKYPWATGATYNNEILKCDKAVPRTEGGQEITGFNINDWSLSNGYTSKLNNFLTYTYAPFVQDISQQVDKKAETFRQATDPSLSWAAEDKPNHVGDIWMDISANGGKKTYIYTDKGADADPRYVWEEQAVPDEVFDEIDGKAEIFVQKPTEYMERDLWIIESGLAAADMPAGCQAGDIVVADNMPAGTTKRTSYVKGDWRKKDRYTDDTALNNFVSGTYSQFVTNIQNQVDQKAETFRQASDPSSSWYDASQTPVYDVRAEHVGDIWMDISANGGKKTYIYTDKGASANPRYVWEAQAVPDAVFDKIDGKAEIFVQKPTEYMERDLWIIESGLAAADMPAGCQAGDIVVADNMPQGTTKRTSYVKGDWRKKDRYTDDTALNNFVSGTYSQFVTNIQNQVDQKAETFRQASDPSSSWYDASQTPVYDVRAEHVGDIWMDISANGGKKTYIYTDKGADADPRYVWEEQDVPDEVFDEIDGKAEIFVQKPTEYMERDLWIIESGLAAADMPAGCQAGDIVVADNMPQGTTKRTSYVKGDWRKKDRYTDDTALNNFVSGTYSQFVTNIQNQVDQKAETFRQASDPSSSWYDASQTPVYDVRAEHVGDIWMDISANGGKKTYIYTDKGASANPRYVWEAQAVPDAVFDEIDGKADIFVSKPSTYNIDDMWIIESSTTTCPEADIPAGCQRGDIVFAKNKRSGSYTKTDWEKRDRYTDDTYAHNFDYLSAAMGGDTDIQGGLILSNTIVLRTLPGQGQEVGNIMAGINGVLRTQLPDRSIAAWYGGDMEDLEAAGTVDPTVRYAKALFRMDGSGYLAKGNISWDNNGNATFKGTISAGTTITDYEYLQTALGGDTSGLVLANQIALKNGNTVMAGMSGAYSAQAPGGGIAAWYGGTKNDRENAPEGTDVSSYAKAIFRMDGSGYLADGNISWDNSGNATFKGTISAGTTITDYQYLKTALGGDTSGLVLANQIALKNGNNIMAGMSGAYSAQAPGGGIAAWYGGTKNDRENAPEGTDVSSYAKTLFRMDGTGYVASGNISWNASGDVTIQGTVVEATTKIDTPAIFLNGTDITATLNAILDMFEKDTTTQPGTTLIKAKYSLYSVGDVSALGNSSGGGGGGGGASVLYELNDVLSNAGGTSVLDAQAGYVLTCVENGGSLKWKAAPTAPTYVLPAATSGALGGIKIGYTDATVGTRNYAVALDNDGKAYVNVPWEDHTYTLAGLMGSTAKGGVTQPIYWDGTEFKNTTYTLGKSVPSNAVFTDTTYSAGTGLSLSGATFSIKELKSGAWFSGTPYVASDGVMEIGRYIDFHPTSASILDFNIRLDAGTGTTARTFTFPDSAGTLLSSGNSSVSKSGSTLTVKINGTEQSLTNTWRPLGNGASDACAGNDSRLSDSRPASDVYSWAKAATKPSYTLDEVNDGSTRKLSSYLPLSGGTMTGVLTLKGSQYGGYMTGSSRTYAMNANNSDIVGINALIMGDKSDGWTESIGFPRDGSDAGHYDTFRAANGTFYFGFNGYYDSSNVEHAASELITMSGSTVKLERSDANNAEMTVKNSNGSVSLLTSTNRGLYNSTGSNWIIATNGTNTWMSVGNVGIGTTSPSYKLHVSGSIYATGDVTAASDQCKKEFVEDVVLTLEQIANAPAVKFRWKDDRDDLVHIGTYAQYWLDILPESVSDRGGELGFTYGNTALVAVKNLARYVMQLEEEVRQLKNKQKKSA